jgi:hypothetical protein
MTNQNRKLVVVVLLVAASSCSFSKGKGAAEAAVVQFHAQFNASQFRDIYNQAHEDFRKSEGEAKVIQYLEALRGKLGTVKQANQKSWHVNSTPAGTMVTLNYDVEFSEGKGTEQFVFRITDDKPLLHTYHVNSPLLITK